MVSQNPEIAIWRYPVFDVFLVKGNPPKLALLLSENLIIRIDSLIEALAGEGFFAGDDAQAKTQVAELITSLGLRPRDAGDLSMAHWLEGAGLLEMGLARGGLGIGFSLGVNIAEGS